MHHATFFALSACSVAVLAFPPPGIFYQSERYGKEKSGSRKEAKAYQPPYAKSQAGWSADLNYGMDAKAYQPSEDKSPSGYTADFNSWKNAKHNSFYREPAAKEKPTSKPNPKYSSTFEPSSSTKRQGEDKYGKQNSASNQHKASNQYKAPHQYRREQSSSNQFYAGPIGIAEPVHNFPPPRSITRKKSVNEPLLIPDPRGSDGVHKIYPHPGKKWVKVDDDGWEQIFPNPPQTHPLSDPYYPPPPPAYHPLPRQQHPPPRPYYPPPRPYYPPPQEYHPPPGGYYPPPRYPRPFFDPYGDYH